MKDILLTFAGIIITGIVVLLCLFSCVLASKSDEFWNDFINKLEEKKNDRR